MPQFSADFLAESTSGQWHFGKPAAVSGFCFDARLLEPGQCFVALSGATRDGHEFVAQAKERGACAAITERAIDLALPQLVVADSLLAMGRIAGRVRSDFAGPVVGVTGSCGKTSTKEMLKHLLGGECVHATAGNWNNRIGVPMTLFELSTGQHVFAVIEAGINQPGEMALLGEMICGDLTIITNIGPAHLELLGSLEGIAEEKSKLAALAQNDSPIILPASVLGYDAFAPMMYRCQVLAEETEAVPEGVRSVVRYKVRAVEDGRSTEVGLLGESFKIETTSKGIATNAALAILAAIELGVPKSMLAERIAQWRPEATRGRIVRGDETFHYIDCYNANPASMRDALAAFVDAAPSKLPRLYVLGAMDELGGQAETMHTEIGCSLELREGDRALFVGTKAMTAAYFRGALESGASASHLECAENVDQLKSTVAEFHGALFLKGSRSYQLENLLPG
jgi:UDP-N-acetylmuramoyl-tripeptide--D-alanyl-D-alanine ligase